MLTSRQHLIYSIISEGLFYKESQKIIISRIVVEKRIERIDSETLVHDCVDIQKWLLETTQNINKVVFIAKLIPKLLK